VIAHQVRVRYAETDQMGVAHHAAYVPWLEEARIAWLRAQGHSYKDLEAAGTMMPVVELSVRYRRAARFDEVLTLETTAVAAGPSRIRFQTRIVRGADLLAEAEVTVATVGSDGRPSRIPAGLQPLLTPAA
jgi:acyl-CoA thioester hydrolase